MDPLTALNVSTSVVQFVSFASDLITKSKEIYKSAKGCTDQVFSLEMIHEQLQDLSLELKASSQIAPRPEILNEKPEIKKRLSAINDLSRLCNVDCDKLLNAVKSLKADHKGKNHWQSFKIAVKTVWKSSEIAELEQRLHRFQTTLTLEVCALTR